MFVNGGLQIEEYVCEWWFTFKQTCKQTETMSPFLKLSYNFQIHAFLYIRMVFFRFNMDILNFWANIILIYS